MNLDRDNVLKGLKNCIDGNCTPCPYDKKKFCSNLLMKDALTLLKEPPISVNLPPEITKRIKSLMHEKRMIVMIVMTYAGELDTLPADSGLLENIFKEDGFENAKILVHETL